MADKRVDQLTDIDALADADSFPVRDASATTELKEVTAAQIATYAEAQSGGVGQVIEIPMQTPMTSGSAAGPSVTGAVSVYAGGIFVNTTAQNTYCEYELYIPQGTWTLAVWLVKNDDAGIVEVSFDGVALSPTFDAYNAALSGNTEVSWSGVVFATPATRLLRFTCVDKNPSSSNYRVRINKIWLRRTA